MPPPSDAAAPSLAGETVEHLLSRTSNEQVSWTLPLDFGSTGRPSAAGPARPSVSSETPADLLSECLRTGPARLPFTTNQIVPPLLDALEDPDKFVAVHVMLSQTTPGSSNTTAYSQQPDGSVVEVFNGLKITLAPGQPHSQFSVGPTGAVITTYQTQCTGRADPAQIPALVAQWHRVLDVQVASVRYWQILVAALVLPGLWLVGTWRGVRRRGAGQCPGCGYDLTGNQSGLCPECGRPVPRNEVPSPARDARSTALKEKTGRSPARWPIVASCAAVVLAASGWAYTRYLRRPAPAPMVTSVAWPTQPIVEGEVGQWVRLGDVELQVRSVGVGPVQRSDAGDSEIGPKLWAHIELRNHGTTPLTYLTWNDCFHLLPPRELADARDDDNRRYRSARWDFVYPPMEGVVSSPLTHFDPENARKFEQRQKAAADELARVTKRFQSEYTKLTDDTEVITPEKLLARQRLLAELISGYYRASHAVTNLEVEATKNPRPDGTLRDTLVLSPRPREDTEFIDLDLPGRNVGQKGTFRIHITGKLLHPFKVWQELRATELRALLGKTPSSPELQRLLDALPDRRSTQNGGQGAHTESSAQVGVSLDFGQSLQLEAITLQSDNSGYGTATRYPGELPADLSFGDRYSDVRQNLGPPGSEQDQQNVVILNYPQRGLDVWLTRNPGVNKENSGPIWMVRIYPQGKPPPGYNSGDAAPPRPAGDDP